MKIQSIKLTKTDLNQNAGQKEHKKITRPASNCYTENSINPLYYKDYFINKKNVISFTGENTGKQKSLAEGCNSVKNVSSVQSASCPQVCDSEFIHALTKTELKEILHNSGKYSEEQTKKILSFIDDIIECDRWEETDEGILCNMFASLAQSTINSDIKTMEYITQKICDLEQDDDYIEINPICKGIETVSANIKADDYRFNKLFIGGYDGFLACSNTDTLYNLCDLIRKSLKKSNTDKFAGFLDVLNRKIKAEDDKLQEVFSIANILANELNYKNDDLINGLLMYLEENTPVDEIAEKLALRKNVSKVYRNLKNINLPDELFFEQIFAAPIEELIKRGYSPEKIAEHLSLEDFCNKMVRIENIKDADSIIFADFIEDIPLYAGNYEIMRKYTYSSGIFNDLLSEYNGNLNVIKEKGFIETEDGRKYSIEEAKRSIKELTRFLDKCHLKRNMTVYRGEGSDVLNQLILENGDLLGDAISVAVKSKDKSRIDEITAEIIGSLIFQPHFMSSAYSKGKAKFFIKHEGGILWQIDVPEGANAIYSDPFNTEHGVENEILLNRNAALLIKDAKVEDGIYTIYADLIN